MAFDTVIDKAQLEAAMTASADAIREKTGDTALIEWLADKGFAEAIEAIEAGGGDCEVITFTPAANGITTFRLKKPCDTAIGVVCMKIADVTSEYTPFWFTSVSDQEILIHRTLAYHTKSGTIEAGIRKMEGRGASSGKPIYVWNTKLECYSYMSGVSQFVVGTTYKIIAFNRGVIE